MKPLDPDHAEESTIRQILFEEWKRMVRREKLLRGAKALLAAFIIVLAAAALALLAGRPVAAESLVDSSYTTGRDVAMLGQNRPFFCLYSSNVD